MNNKQRIQKGVAGLKEMPDNDKWTTDRPNAEGFYWAYEGLDRLGADVYLVWVFGDGRYERCIVYEKNVPSIWETDGFSHWMRIEEPEPPAVEVG